MPKSGMGKVKITAPVPGSCPVCATVHDEREPHDPESLYYQNLFHKIYRRFPTWADAMYHCDAETKAAWVEKLAKQGIRVVLPEDGK